MEPVEFGHELANELVHVFDIIGVEPVGVGAGRAIGRGQKRFVRVGHRIIQEEWLGLMLGNKVGDEAVLNVWQVLVIQ